LAKPPKVSRLGIEKKGNLKSSSDLKSVYTSNIKFRDD